MVDKNYLIELRQGSLNDLQAALERVQQLRGAIAMLDVLINQTQQLEKSDE
jgi:hypothetical protein